MAFPTIPTAGASTLLTTNQSTATTTHTFPNLSTLPNTPHALLLAVIVTYLGGSANAEFSGWGGGFTEFVDQSANSATIQSIGAAYKLDATGSESGTFTVTTVGSTRSVMFLMEIPGAHVATLPEATAKANGTTAAADPASLDPANWAAEDTLWIAVGVSGETSTTSTYTGLASAPANFSDYLDSGIIGGDIVGAVEGAVAFRQLNASSLDVAGFGVDITNAGNSALLIAVRPAAVTDVNVPDAAAATATSEQPAASVDVNAECATAVATGNDATVSFDAPGTNAPADAAEATATGQAASASVDPNAEAVMPTATAETPTTAVSPNSEAAAAVATSNNAATEIGPNAEAAAAVATGNQASVFVDANAECATATATADNATVQTTGSTNANAECATATVGNDNAAAAVEAAVEAALAAAIAPDPSTALDVFAEAVAIVAAAYNAVITGGEEPEGWHMPSIASTSIARYDSRTAVDPPAVGTDPGRQSSRTDTAIFTASTIRGVP
jgi:hypothetical protein